MRTELQSLLKAYLGGRASRRDLGIWLAEFDWDCTDPDVIALQNEVATLDLILTEVAEGLRAESELQEIAVRLTDAGSRDGAYVQSMASVDERST